MYEGDQISIRLDTNVYKMVDLHKINGIEKILKKIIFL